MSSPFFAITEPARQTPVVFEADLCVVGGSCTGIFAAVRAARLGLKVAVAEQNTLFGGMAVAAQVNVWNSTLDAFHEQRIIGGLTIEAVERLRKRSAVQEIPPGKRNQFYFNSAELCVELDELVREHNIRPFLCSRVVAAVREGNRVDAVIIEDKSGRRAIRARQFIDASGDGDLMRRAGFAAYQRDQLQPANLQALIYGFDELKGDYVRLAIQNRTDEFDYPRDNSTPWLMNWPGAPGIYNTFSARLNGVDASNADDLTATLMEARRIHRALLDMVKAESGGQQLNVVAWAHALGVRETWHAHCLHQLTVDELLRGEKFPDAIANGTYPNELAAGDSDWHVAGLDDFYYCAEFGNFLVVFMGDHAACEKGWWTSHGHVNDDDYPYPADSYEQLRHAMRDHDGPVIIASHYALPGGQRPSPLMGRLLPLPDNVRMHLHGHAHIGDLVWNKERPWQRENSIDGHGIKQFNISALESKRTPGSHSALLELYPDGAMALRIRCHLEKRWIEEFWI